MNARSNRITKWRLALLLLPAATMPLGGTFAADWIELGPAPIITGKLVYADRGYRIDLAKPDIVKSAGEYKLLVYYIAEGTRSEGIHGVLVENGEVVDALQDQTELKTGLGILVYRGPWEKRTLLFDQSGWLPKDLTGIYPSWEE